MSKRKLSPEEMRLKGLQMIRKAKDRERRQREATRAALGELVEQHIASSFREFDLAMFLLQIEGITGKHVSLEQKTSPTEGAKSDENSWHVTQASRAIHNPCEVPQTADVHKIVPTGEPLEGTTWLPSEPKSNDLK